MRRLISLLSIVALAISLSAGADLLVEVNKGDDRATPIAIVPLRYATGIELPEKIDEIVAADLARSGLFRPIPRTDMLSFPSVAEEVYFRDWRVQGVEYIVIGRVTREVDRYSVTYELFDINQQRRLFSETLRANDTQLRDLSHVMADMVYEKLTGTRGAFATKLAFVLAQRIATPQQRFRLEISDSDGARSRTVFESSDSLMSPAWSPDAKQLAYVSFETGRSAIYLHDLASGNRQRIADFKGLNSAPTFSPDGRSLAMVLSRDGNPEIYIMDLASRRLRQVTRYRDIDTEPSWTVDGKNIAFTSNRGGGPQVYNLEVATGMVERLTFEGDYNARPRTMPDGSKVVYVHRVNQIFHIAVLDFASGRNTILTQTALDESPSVAPNGSMLIYATNELGRGILGVVSIDGRVKYSLPSPDGDVREPAWSPFLDVRSRLQ